MLRISFFDITRYRVYLLQEPVKKARVAVFEGMASGRILSHEFVPMCNEHREA